MTACCGLATVDPLVTRTLYSGRFVVASKILLCHVCGVLRINLRSPSAQLGRPRARFVKCWWDDVDVPVACLVDGRFCSERCRDAQSSTHGHGSMEWQSSEGSGWEPIIHAEHRDGKMSRAVPRKGLFTPHPKRRRARVDRFTEWQFARAMRTYEERNYLPAKRRRWIGINLAVME